MGAAWIAFIDDDEQASPDWLVRAMEAVDAYGSNGPSCSYCGCPSHRPVDAVHGVVKYVYPADAAPWRCRAPWPPWGHVDGMELDCAGTGNVVFRASKVRGLRFDTSLNTSGGEDTEFFRRFHAGGGRIILSMRAVVTETVTWDRITLRGHWRKAYRNGTHKGARMKRPRAIRKAARTMARGVFKMLLTPVSRKTGLSGFLHIAESFGLLRKRPYNYYSETTGC